MSEIGEPGAAVATNSSARRRARASAGGACVCGPGVSPRSGWSGHHPPVAHSRASSSLRSASGPREKARHDARFSRFQPPRVALARQPQQPQPLQRAAQEEGARALVLRRVGAGVCRYAPRPAALASGAGRGAPPSPRAVSGTAAQPRRALPVEVQVALKANGFRQSGVYPPGSRRAAHSYPAFLRQRRPQRLRVSVAEGHDCSGQGGARGPQSPAPPPAPRAAWPRRALRQSPARPSAARLRSPGASSPAGGRASAPRGPARAARSGVSARSGSIPSS